MITIFKSKADIPEVLELVILNDVYFNKNTFEMLDERAKKIKDYSAAAVLLLSILAAMVGIYVIGGKWI